MEQLLNFLEDYLKLIPIISILAELNYKVNFVFEELFQLPECYVCGEVIAE